GEEALAVAHRNAVLVLRVLRLDLGQGLVWRVRRLGQDGARQDGGENERKRGAADKRHGRASVGWSYTICRITSPRVSGMCRPCESWISASGRIRRQWKMVASRSGGVTRPSLG